jgi:Domain of unknown function (DUF4365)
MSSGTGDNPSVDRNFEIDQRAIKIFKDWLPDNWLARKQDPDVFVDYEVETVDNGEPTGFQFAAQIKGYEGENIELKPPSYSFKTKHLNYYLHQSQHPVFLFRINITNGEGFWLFAQKHLREQVSPKILGAQKYLTIPFVSEDNFVNKVKFKCALLEARTYMHDLHPGTIQAALQHRKTELESKDHRCSVSISIQDGHERVIIHPKEPFSFSAKIRSQNVKGWKDFFERGTKVKVKPGEIEIEGSPLIKEIFESTGGGLEIQYGQEHPGSLHFIANTSEGPQIIPIDGRFRSGMKYLTFHGSLPDSPLGISFEISREAILNAETFNSAISFSPSKWAGQPILLLAHFDQIKAFVEAFSGTAKPKMEIFVRGNSVVKGEINDGNPVFMKQIGRSIKWFSKCRWLAQHFQINPVVPPLDKLSEEQMDDLEDLHDLLTMQEKVTPKPHIQISIVGSGTPPQEAFAKGYDSLRIEKPEMMIDFWGTPVRLGPAQHLFSEMKLVSQTPSGSDGVKLVFEGTANTKLTSTLISDDASKK